MDCCYKDKNTNYDLIIIGSGSAAFAGALRAVELGARVAMIERGTVGGTCVNVGCIPSKTLIRTAEAKHRAEHPGFKGLNSKSIPISFETIIQEKDELVTTLQKAKYLEVLQSHEGIDLIEGQAFFVSSHEVQVGNQTIKGEHFIIATGASPSIPPIPGLNDINYLTSTTALELKKLPRSVVVLGGRYIALELAQMFQRMGTKVTILQRSSRILPTEDQDLTDELTKYLSQEGMTIQTGVTIHNVSKSGSLQVNYEREGETQSICADQLLIATGRRPNTNQLNLENIGVNLNTDGSIKTNEYGQTSQSHIYAAGDVIGDPAFVYTAAYEGNLAVENALNGNSKVRDYSIVPSVIFTDPQVARVGLNELQAKEKKIDVDVSNLTMDNVPRALAARDTRGFVKLLKKKGTDQLAGASILAPEGSELLMEITLAMKYKIPISDIASTFHPYLTLGEAVKLAAQTFNKDVKKLSCCAE
ncbi:MAG: mercury(II) reductase [Nitrospinota bacterium]